MPDRRLIVETQLRAATLRYQRKYGLSQRDIVAGVGCQGERVIINLGTLADWLRGHPSNRPDTESHLTTEQAEALAQFIGCKLRLERKE